MSSSETETASAVDAAVAEGGAYEVIRERLTSQGRALTAHTTALNEQRAAEFGGAEMAIAGRVRVRTENNCVARDIVQVGELVLFGYNVFIGLKHSTRVEDVFATFREKTNEAGEFELEPVLVSDTFLGEGRFRNDFEELYRYYKHARLDRLVITNGKLLAGFQIGERLEDVRVFRWSVSADLTQVDYIDNRGERDIAMPSPFGFEWQTATRDDFVEGRDAHVNVLDTVFVDTLNGTLTVRVENNTDAGRPVFEEPVEDENQSLADAELRYAKLGSLILIDVLPYRETRHRYLVCNTFNETVVRLDAIGLSCVELPEDHGIIFPGGYYLENGEHKTFERDGGNFRYKRMIRSPNGEDVLYVFYDVATGEVGLFGYNLIDKRLHNPLHGHGYALSEQGRLLLFVSGNEPTRVHPIEAWTTPYVSDEFASQQPPSQTFLGRIGNPAVVRAVSDLYSIGRMVEQQSVSLRLYEELLASVNRMRDAHYWLDAEPTAEIQAGLAEIGATAELVIDEFEKVTSIREASGEAFGQAHEQQEELLRTVRYSEFETAEQYVSALGSLRRQRGHLTTLRELRYIDLDGIVAMDAELGDAEQALSERTVEFLSAEDALKPYLAKVASLTAAMQSSATVAEMKPHLAELDGTSEGLDLLSELLATLKVADATLRTRIVDAISEVYGAVNQAKAVGRNLAGSLGADEAVAEFSAQFKLFSQSINNALGMATTPERCEEQLSRLLMQLEELESQFAEHDQFLTDIVTKREEIYEAFEAHRQQLVDARQRRAQSTADAADRILGSVEKRSLKHTEEAELNAFFASDAMVAKARDLAQQLRELDATVQADDVDSRLKALRAQAVRSLRDKSDLFEEGGNVIKLGPRHRFSVSTQDLDLTILPRRDGLALHLSGTDYFDDIESDELLALRHVWDMTLPSETPELYRAEYLAGELLEASREPEQGAALRAAVEPDAMLALVRDYAAPRYRDGYERGIHDHDAARLLGQLVPMLEHADLLRYDPATRALAQVFWGNREFSDVPARASSATHWPVRAGAAAALESSLASRRAIELLIDEVAAELDEFVDTFAVTLDGTTTRRAAEYLVAELGNEHPAFITSKYATRLVAELKQHLEEATWRGYQSALRELAGQPGARLDLTIAWLEALAQARGLETLSRFIPEAAAILNVEERIDRRTSEAELQCEVSGLLGQHPRVEGGALHLSLDEFLGRIAYHKSSVLPDYERFGETRHGVIETARDTLRVDELKARPLSSFVRNRLVNEVYLPIIGDNLAKQIGTVGEDKRSDLMGLLMMISPPGYGKTTLMEYAASRLGLIFMKINCPSLGHDVMSLDPEQAPNATARQELEKINLSFEMGNNVMLYLDDIQHTHPEFLQKFISLCDGTRRVEGVWRGRTRTYDMRGRRFCVVMAGNPYTESGETFKVPDMLANRADIYNLGDILGGKDEQFGLSYIENSLTSNAVLSPLAMRDMADVYRFVRRAQGEDVASSDFSHHYSAAESTEIEGILKAMFKVRDVILAVNQQYIASAAQDDRYRAEPPFKLQGSYRNMNKMVEKLSAVMTEAELHQLITDHYLGEAQLLTTGAEANLLKLAELRGNMTEAESARWSTIKADFARNKAMGGDEGDVGNRVVGQLADIVAGLQALKLPAPAAGGDTIPDAGPADSGPWDGAVRDLHGVTESLVRLGDYIATNRPKVEVINQPSPGVERVLQALAQTVREKAGDDTTALAEEVRRLREALVPE